MKRLFSLIIIIFTFLFANNSAQIMPNYSGRTNLFNFDSTRQFVSSGQYLSASDGVLDAESYYIGPGDRFLINIQAITPLTFNTIVNYEGYIYVEQVGLIKIDDLTLAEAKKKIIKHLSTFFKNASIDVVLTDFKKIRVSLTGNVFKSYTYTLNGNIRLLDLIMNSYGLYSNSDLRNISILDKQGKSEKYDLLKFIRLADKNNNPILREGAVVIIKTVDQTVTVHGNVFYPGTYELAEGDNLGSILELCGGLNFKAKEDSIELVSFSDDNRNTTLKYFDYKSIKSENIQLKSGDRIIVREKSEFMIDRFVSVFGFVKYPGVYRIEKNKTTLKELILESVGGFLEKASLKDAYIIRHSGSAEKDIEFERLKTILRTDMTDDEYDYFKAKSREKKGKMVVDFEKLFVQNDSSEDLVLKEGDEIFIPELVSHITLVGQVVNPGNIIYHKNYSVSDYITLAGGFSWRAIKGDVRVIKANTGEWIDAEDAETLEPGDIIWIPEETPPPKFWEIFKDSMLIVGQIAALITAIVAVIISSRN